jgi:hypothetical protein
MGECDRLFEAKGGTWAQHGMVFAVGLSCISQRAQHLANCCWNWNMLEERRRQVSSQAVESWTNECLDMEAL